MKMRSVLHLLAHAIHRTNRTKRSPCSTSHNLPLPNPKPLRRLLPHGLHLGRSITTLLPIGPHNLPRLRRNIIPGHNARPQSLGIRPCRPTKESILAGQPMRFPKLAAFTDVQDALEPTVIRLRCFGLDVQTIDAHHGPEEGDGVVEEVARGGQQVGDGRGLAEVLD